VVLLFPISTYILGFILQSGLLEPAGLQLHHAFRGVVLQLILGAEGDAAGGAGLHARGFQADRNAIGTQRALVDLSVFLRNRLPLSSTQMMGSS
jgi:hypothetical protein